LTIIGGYLGMERAYCRRAGTWIVPPLLKYMDIGKYLNATGSIPSENRRRFAISLDKQQILPSGMEICSVDFGCLEVDGMKWMCKIARLAKEYTS
jgi:hypothetical protein